MAGARSRSRAPERDDQEVLRQQLLAYLKGGHAHAEFDQAVAGLPTKLRGGKPAGQPHTPWRLVEHLRIAQHDILEFCRDPEYESPPWPQGYWPPGDGPPTERAWEQSIRAYRADRRAFEELIADPRKDLLIPIPHGQGQTLLREAILIIDHAAYHVAQLIIVRRLLGAWEGQ
jgi:hypothetical protein